jgi:hypothetical protein
VALALGLLAPATASADTYMVNNTGDAADANVGTEGCDSIAGGALQCTLRAAIEESNNSTAVDDNIYFDESIFIGDPNGNKVTINSDLPAITDKVKIAGDIFGKCEVPTKLPGEPIILGPCVQLQRSNSGIGLIVEADEVEIDGLAIVGMSFAVDVLDESNDFVAKGNWIGVKLDGENGGNTNGIFIDPGSDGAVIGGPNEPERNVIGYNSQGLDLEGASEATIDGNYFGMAPDGVTLAHNFLDLEITDSTAGSGFPATENHVGADVGPTATATAACDSACNVFASRQFPGSTNIDLKGQGGGTEAPASGPTSIVGNYIGLDATGGEIPAAGLGGAGILVGGADEVLIGDTGEGARNLITGGTHGILAGKEADDLVVTNNWFGRKGDGDGTVETPTSAGIFDSSEDVSEEDAAEITENVLFMGAGSVAIEQHGVGALIAGNLIIGATTGIRLWGDSEGAGSTVESNEIENTFGNGVLIENDDNLLVDNLVLEAKAAGVRIKNYEPIGPPGLASTGNTIGGDEEVDENTIVKSQGDAIEVAGDENDETLIARNNGAGNEGLFIDLGADGSGNAAEGPNGGIQAPTISSATPAAASGSALPGAQVRVFLKATAEAGEIDSFLGQVTADGSGNWTLSYGLPLTFGTNIGATQTGLLGTSELATATTEGTTVPPPPGGTGDTGKKKKGKGKKKAKGKDKTPPQTTITKGPKRTHKRTVKFKFKSSEANSTFKCKLDRKPFKKCRSPKKYKKLKPGKHVFKVKAKDAAGNVDPTPAKRVFRILK